MGPPSYNTRLVLQGSVHHQFDPSELQLYSRPFADLPSFTLKCICPLWHFVWMHYSHFVWMHYSHAHTGFLLQASTATCFLWPVSFLCTHDCLPQHCCAVLSLMSIATFQKSCIRVEPQVLCVVQTFLGCGAQVCIMTNFVFVLGFDAQICIMSSFVFLPGTSWFLRLDQHC